VTPERHQRAIRALQAGGPEAPDALQRRVERTVGAARPLRRPLGWRPRLLAATAAAAAAALIIGLAVGAGGGPSVTAVASVSALPPAQPAEPDHAFAGVTYPDWSGEFGWRAIGARSDTLDGRRADTVFYTHEGHVIGYTVLEGEPIEPPASADTITRDGVELHRFRDGHRDVVMFERNGRTCVIAGHVIHADTLAKLAAAS
jgi:hypothetical protein